MEKGEIAQNEQFHLFPQCVLFNLYLKILSVVVCSFFEFGTVSKWCIRDWIKEYNQISPKEHSCENWQKWREWFQRRRFSKISLYATYRKICPTTNPMFFKRSKFLEGIQWRFTQGTSLWNLVANHSVVSEKMFEWKVYGQKDRFLSQETQCHDNSPVGLWPVALKRRKWW